MSARIPLRRPAPPLVVAALLSCAPAAALTGIAGDSERVCIQGAKEAVVAEVEIARSAAERSTGLSGRSALAPGAGMLFLYSRPRPADSGFWMYRTRIPLDIAYLGPDGEIRAIRRMAPCPNERAEGCPVYRAGVRYQAALEVNAGFFARHGIRIGDRVVVATADCGR